MNRKSCCFICFLLALVLFFTIVTPVYASTNATYYHVDSSTLILRKSASVASSVIAKLSKGTVLLRLDTSVKTASGYTWYHMRDLATGKEGYAATKYITEINGLVKVMGTIVNCVSSVNLRKNASTSSAILGVAPKGSTYAVTNPFVTSSWHQIIYNGSAAFISTSFVKLAFTVSTSSQPTANPTPTPTPVPTSTTAPTPTPSDIGTNSIGTVVNCTSYANVRKGPGTSYASLGTAAKGMVYIVQKAEGFWYKIDYAGGSGYIHKDYLRIASSSSDAVTVKIATFNVKTCNYGKSINEIASLIKFSGADIIGIQEVERNCIRSNYMDMSTLLAQKTGLSHYVFTKSIDYRGGEYGTLLLSRYPILQSEMSLLNTLPSAEDRSVRYAKILTGVKPLYLFSTHLSNESAEANAVTLDSLESYIHGKNNGDYVVIGDFNTLPDTVLSHISRVSAANSSFKTHRGREIDNILYTTGISVSDLIMIDAVSKSYSDHNMLICKVTLPSK